MTFTMVKRQLFIIHLLCVITLSASAKSIGIVKEFEIDDLGEKQNAKEHLDSTANIPAQIEVGNINNKESLENSNSNTDDSMYTDSDLETVSDERVGPTTKNKEPINIDKEIGKADDNNLLDIYTEADLDETKSEDEMKHKDVKKSASSYLHIIHKRNLAEFEDNNVDGSGEGSGDLPPSI